MLGFLLLVRLQIENHRYHLLVQSASLGVPLECTKRLLGVDLGARGHQSNRFMTGCLANSAAEICTWSIRPDGDRDERLRDCTILKLSAALHIRDAQLQLLDCTVAATSGWSALAP